METPLLIHDIRWHLHWPTPGLTHFQPDTEREIQALVYTKMQVHSSHRFTQDPTIMHMAEPQQSVIFLLVPKPIHTAAIIQQVEQERLVLPQFGSANIAGDAYEKSS